MGGLAPAGVLNDVHDRANSALRVSGAALAGAWDSYTPALEAVTTDPTLSDDASHTAVGEYIQIGTIVMGYALITFGSSGVAAGSGVYGVTLPVAPKTFVNATPLGTGYLTDVSGDITLAAAVRLTVAAGAVSTDHATLLTAGTVATGSASGGIYASNANPHIWAAGDVIGFDFRYEAA